MTKKYLLCPGYVTSENDGQRHWIGVNLLAELYGVDMAECVREGQGVEDGLIRLEPRKDGNYVIPGK